MAHLKIHSDKKTYKCPYCPKVFAQSVGLRSHLINHTGERKYECDICNKKFLRIGARNNHRKIHTGQKDYACPLCEKKFTASSTRNKHLLTHTGKYYKYQNINNYIHRQHASPHLFFNNIENLTKQKIFELSEMTYFHSQFSAENS